MGMILIHWSRVSHICVNNRNIIGSDNDWSPGRRPAVISSNAWIFLIWTPTTNFSEILIESHTSSFKKVHFKISSGKWRPFCPGLNVLKNIGTHSCEKQNKIYTTTLSLKKTSNIYIYMYEYMDNRLVSYFSPRIIITCFPGDCQHIGSSKLIKKTLQR